jgi:hypothetical protein
VPQEIGSSVPIEVANYGIRQTRASRKGKRLDRQVSKQGCALTERHEDSHGIGADLRPDNVALTVAIDVCNTRTEFRPSVSNRVILL